MTLDNTCATKILAVSLLQDETEESFQFACECFQDCFRVPPAVIFTDSDPAMKAAIAVVFPNAQHLLCIWHLSKNLFKNVRPACGSDDELWHRILSGWWRIVKQSDESSRASFDTEWAALATALAGGTTATGKSLDTARKWLDKLAASREQWAFRWTWRHLTMGMHSTQRIEAVHSAITGCIRANTLLTTLLPALESYSSHVASSAETRAFRHSRLYLSAGKCNPHPFIDAAAKFLSPYALTLLKAQLQQAAFYVLTPAAMPGTFTATRVLGEAPALADTDVDDADVGLASARFSAPRTTRRDGCSCQFMSCYGLPCRHVLRLLDVEQQPVPEALFHIRWRLLDAARLRSLTEALLRCRPPRAAGAAGVVALTRDDRYALAMGACRAVAELAATSDASYNRFRSELSLLADVLRKPAATDGRGHAAAVVARAGGGGAGGSSAGGGGANGGARGTGGGSSGGGSEHERSLCRACWQPGHRKSNRLCPRYGKPPLPKPGGERMLAHRAAAARDVRAPLADLDDELEASGDDSPEDSGRNETVCHRCAHAGDLVCCETCPHSWHALCLPEDAMPVEDDEWQCPVCAGSNAHAGFVGNPQQPPHCGRRQSARKRGAAEGTKAQVAAAKKARRQGGDGGGHRFR